MPVEVDLRGRPEVLNRVDAETSAELDAAFTALEQDPDVWVVVFTGALGTRRRRT